MLIAEMKLKGLLTLILGVAMAPLVCAQHAVLYTGSDWCLADDAAEKIFDSPEFAKAAGVKLVKIDQPERVTDAVRETWKKQAAFRYELARYPGFAYFDKNGRCVFLKEGLPWNIKEDTMLKLVERGKAREKEIAKLLEQGTVESLAKAIKLTLDELGLKRSRERPKGMLDAWISLETKDPKDESGWRAALTFNPNEATYKIQDFAKNKDFAGGENFIRSINTKHLSTNQRQGLKLLSYVLYKDVPEKKAANLALLKEVAEMDNKTHFGAGAYGKYRSLTGNPCKAPGEKALPKRPSAAKATFTFPPAPKKNTIIYTYARSRISPDTIRQIAARKGGAEFLTKFFSDATWMKDFFRSGPPKPSWDACLMALDTFAYHVPLKNRAMKRWATAAALNVGEADETKTYNLFAAFMKIRARKLLWSGADKQNVGEMRYVLTPKQTNARELLWISTQYNVPPRSYHGVCWYAPYRLFSFFGDSIHGPHYYAPWIHHYNIREASREVGGVCGSLSHFGSIAAKAHGVPTTPGGQPGHCAFPLYSPSEGRWQIGYSVSPYTGAHFQLWSWTFSYLDLAFDTFSAKGRNKAMSIFWKTEADRFREEPQPYRSMMTCTVFDTWAARTLPKDMSTVKTVNTVKNLSSFDLSVGKRNDCLLLSWKGNISVNKDMDVVFNLKSDDGSRLLLDGETFIDNDGCHGMDLREKKTRLTAGSHPFELHYFNLGGARGLEMTAKVIYPFNEKWVAGYEQALKASPMSYDIWHAYESYLAECADTPISEWKKFARNAATALSVHPQPAWDLIEKHALPAIDKKEGKGSLTDFMCQLHGIIRQSERPTAEFFNFTELLNRHAKLLGNDPRRSMEIFNAALNGQYGTKDAFGIVLRWGGSQFLSDNALAGAYVKSISDLLRKKGSSGNIDAFLGGAIREASNSGNTTAFQSLCDLHETLSGKTRERIDFSKLTTFPLLSDKGLLRTSSTSNWDKGSAYRQVIDGRVAGDNFHTAQEQAPWVEVVLPGPAEISAVYIQNVGNQNNSRVVPFSLEISEDGKNWKQVAKVDKVQNEWNLKFPPTTGKYVRLNYTGKNGKTYLHLRKFCVFGKKLY